MATQPDPLPVDALRDAATPEAHPSIDALHAELGAANPNGAKIRENIEHLRGFPALVPTLEAWFLHPNTQLFMAELTELGF